MKRIAAALLGLACFTGCRMCACPYDDCYPVIDGNSYHGAPAAQPGPVIQDEYGAPSAAQSRNAGPHLAKAQ